MVTDDHNDDQSVPEPALLTSTTGHFFEDGITSA